MCCRTSTQKKHKDVLAKRLHITPISRARSAVRWTALPALPPW